MPNFSYTAVDATGKQKTGTMDANNVAEATTRVKQLGLFPTTVVEVNRAAAAMQVQQNVKKSLSFSFGQPKVKGKTLMVFTRQLATLIDAGLPLLRSLKTLLLQEKNPDSFMETVQSELMRGKAEPQTLEKLVYLILAYIHYKNNFYYKFQEAHSWEINYEKTAQ